MKNWNTLEQVEAALAEVNAQLGVLQSTSSRAVHDLFGSRVQHEEDAGDPLDCSTDEHDDEGDRGDEEHGDLATTLPALAEEEDVFTTPLEASIDEEEDVPKQR